MRIGDTGRIRWVRVGRWLLAATPVGGPRVYRLLTQTEQAKALRCEAWEPDVALWGGRPADILTTYTGQRPPAVGIGGIGKPAGLAEEADTYLSQWAPNSDDDEGVPPESRCFHPTDLTKTRDRLTFNDRELVVNYHTTKGEATITCGYCEAKLKSRNLQRLLRWYRTHECFDSRD